MKIKKLNLLSVAVCCAFVSTLEAYAMDKDDEVKKEKGYRKHKKKKPEQEQTLENLNTEIEQRQEQLKKSHEALDKLSKNAKKTHTKEILSCNKIYDMLTDKDNKELEEKFTSGVSKRNVYDLKKYERIPLDKSLKKTVNSLKDKHVPVQHSNKTKSNITITTNVVHEYNAVIATESSILDPIREAKLAKKNAELAKKNEELAKKDEELAKKNAEIDKLKAERTRKRSTHSSSETRVDSAPSSSHLKKTPIKEPRQPETDKKPVQDDSQPFSHKSKSKDRDRPKKFNPHNFPPRETVAPPMPITPPPFPGQPVKPSSKIIKQPPVTPAGGFQNGEVKPIKVVNSPQPAPIEPSQTFQEALIEAFSKTIRPAFDPELVPSDGASWSNNSY